MALSDDVYRRIRTDILDGRVNPSSRFSEQRLSKLFDVSRTPVREALRHLLADGLIQRSEGGYSVVVPSLHELRELYELRITLELRGISRTIENPELRHDRDILVAELEKWYEIRNAPPDPDPGIVLLDERFHAELSRASGNMRVTEALVAVNSRIRAIRMHDFVEAERIWNTINEHIEIVELVLDQQPERALAALHEHVGKSLEVVLERASRALSAMVLSPARIDPAVPEAWRWRPPEGRRGFDPLEPLFPTAGSRN